MENIERRQEGFRFSDISITFLGKQLLRRFYIVAAALLLFGLCAWGVSFLSYEERYEAELTAAVTFAENPEGAAQLAANLAELLNNATTAQRFFEEAGDRTLQMTAKQIPQTNILVIRILGSTPEQALSGCFTLGRLLPEFCSYISSGLVGTVLRQEVAEAPAEEWNPWLRCILWALAGAALVALLLCRYDVMRHTVQTRSYARRMLPWTKLAELPPRWKRLEQRRHAQVGALCVRVEQSHNQSGKQVFLVAATQTGEGSAAVAQELGKRLAVRGRKTVIANFDLRNAEQFKDAAQHPVSVAALLKAQEMPAADSFFRCVDSGAYVLPAGEGDETLTQLLVGSHSSGLLEFLRSQFDYVIVNVPPVGEYADGEALAAMADTAILVIRQGQAPVGKIRKAGAALEGSGCEVLGYVLHDFLQSPKTGDPHCVPPLDVVCLAQQCVRRLRRSWILFAVMAGVFGSWFGVTAANEQRVVYETSTVLSLFSTPTAGTLDAVSLKMATAFPEMIQTGWVRDGVELLLNREIPVDAVTAETVKNTNLVTLTVQAESAQEARAILNAYLAVYPQIAGHTAPQPVLQVRQEAGEPVARVLGRSVVSSSVWGVLLGVGVSICVVGCYGVFAQPLQSLQQLEELLGTEVVAAEPKNRESYATLRLRVQKLCCERGGNVAALIAADDIPQAHEAAVMLATALAEAGSKTILVDCGWNRPAVHTFFGGKADGRSLQQCLKAPNELEVCLKSTAVPRLMYLSAEEMSEFVWEAEAMDTVFRQLCEQADYVILDVTGQDNTAVAQHFLGMSSAILLAAKRDVSGVFQIHDFADKLESWDIHPNIGVFLP